LDAGVKHSGRESAGKALGTEIHGSSENPWENYGGFPSTTGGLLGKSSNSQPGARDKVCLNLALAKPSQNPMKLQCPTRNKYGYKV
jgi:hypothetical protein